MTETYQTPNGLTWNVSEAKKASFMVAHPNAILVSDEVETSKAGVYDVRGMKFNVSDKGWSDFRREHGQDAVRVGSLLEGKKTKKLSLKDLQTHKTSYQWDLFDDAEDEIVTNLSANDLITKLNIKVEGPDDDQRLDRSGRHDDVRLTNEWGKSIIINKSKSDYIKTLNAFVQKTSDAREHSKSDYHKDKAFKDWGVVTPRGGEYGTEQVLSHADKIRVNEERQGISFEEYKKEKEDRILTETKVTEGVMGFFSESMDVIGGTVSDVFAGKAWRGLGHENIKRVERERDVGYEDKLKKEYEQWKNRYSPELLPLNLKNADGITEEEYIKSKVSQEVFDDYANYDLSVGFDEYYKDNAEVMRYQWEYNNKKTRAVLNENKGSIKRYFGIDVSDEVAKGDFSKLTEEQLKDPKLKAFIDFKNNISDEDTETFDNYNNEVEKSKKSLSAGGVSRDIITTIFGNNVGEVGRDDFLEWFENDSDMQGQSNMRFNKSWNPILGEYEYIVKREVDGDDSDLGITDEYKASVISGYLSHKSEIIKRNQQLYENHGVDELIKDINGFQKQREALENEFLLKRKELENLQKQFENGSLEKNEKNINKYNKILKQTKALQVKADNAHRFMQEKLTPANRELIDGYVALGDDITSLRGAQLRFLNNTSFGKDYAEKMKDQKATDEWYENSAWNTFGIAEGVAELVNVIPRALGGFKDLVNTVKGGVVTIGDSKEDKDFYKESMMLAREMPQNPIFEDGFGVIPMHSAQPLTDPLTGQIDYGQLLPQTLRTVGDMAVMILGTKGLGAVTKGAGVVVKKGLLKYGTKATTLGKLEKGYKGLTSSRVLAVPASLPVILPQNLDAAYAQISEDFSASDAYEYAVQASVMEAMVEMINPDIGMAKRSLAKIRKGLNKGESVVDAFKGATKAAFLESLSMVPMEILEEFIQITQSGVINRAYNQAYGTDFQMPDASEYKDTAILTALSVLTMRGLSGNLLHQNQSGLLRIASQYRNETIEELNRRMKLDPNAKEYVSEEDAKALVLKLDTYQIIESEVKDILFDENGKWNATQSQWDALTGLVSMRHDLESQIENATGKNLAKLKAELESVNQNIKNQRNTVKATDTTHKLNQANRAVEKTEEALKKERARKNKRKSNKKEKELIKELERNEKDAKRLKALAPEYQVNNIVYKNREEFLAAINGHKMNGNLKKGMQLNIQVKNDYDAERLAYKVMNNYAPNSLSQKGGKAKVVMSVKLATQISDSLDGNKTDAQNKEDVNKELNEQLLKPVKSQNKENIQRLRDTLSYLDLKQEGYVFGTKGFLAKPKVMDQVKLNNALLDRNIEAVSEATKAFGAKTRVLTTAQVIKEFGKDLGDWSLSTNGFFIETRDKNGNVNGFQFIVNKEVSDRNKANSVASHEMLHGLTHSLINGPRRPITDKNGKVHYVEMTKEGRKLIEGFLKLLTKDQVAILDAKLDEGQYRFSEYTKVGGKYVGVKGTELPLETYGEEYLNHFHDVVVLDKTISLKNIWKKIAKFFTDIFKKELPDATNIDIKTPEDLLKFLKSYNKQTVESKFNDNIIELGKSSRAKFISDKAIDKKNKEYQAWLRGNRKKSVEVKPQRTDIKGEVEFDTDDKRDLFSKTNEELSAALEAYGLKGEFDRENPQHIDLWNRIPQEEKLFIGYSIGIHWKKFIASKLDTSKQSQLFNYDLHRDDMIDVLTQGIETNNNGLPYVVRSWDPTKRALTSHIFGELPKRIPHVTQLKQFASLGVATGAIDLSAPIPADVMPYSELTPGKVRKIKTLADVTLENKEVISSIIRAEIDALVNLNPDNLEEQLTKIIEKEILKAVKAQMGPITQKVEGFVTEEYKQFLALNYENIIKGLDTPTIKKSYNQLFELVKTGTESKITRKKDKPSLKKDSYFEKGIYSITTNKAKFTKYFIEGKYTTLIEKQKGLAKIIAEGITEDIINNEIIENSKNLNAVTEAKLRDFANSLNKQKNEVQGNYNDQIRYSRIALSDTAFLLGEIADLGIDGVFDLNTGTLLPKYKTRNLEAADFVWNDIYLAGEALDRQDPRVIQKQFQKLFDAGKRGTAYEQSIIDMVIALEKQFGIDAIEAVLRKPTEKGGKPDAIIKLYNKTINIEAKMANAQYSSVTFAIDKKTGEFIIKKDYSFNDEIMDKLSPRVKEGIELTREMLRKAVNPETGQIGYEWTDLSTMPAWAYAMITGPTAKKVMFKGKMGTHFTHMSPTINIGLDIVSEIYNKKKGYPVNVIQMMGRGLFYMGGFNNTPNFLNLPALKGKGLMTLRISATTPSSAATQADVLANNTINDSVFVNGKSGERHQIKRPDRKNISWRAFPLIPPTTLETLKSSQSIGNIDGLMNLLESKEAQALKNIKDSEDTMTLGNAIRSSRTVNESKGMSAWDLDDTLARTKSGVKYTIPNPDMTPQPKRKVIFMAGGPGSGKSTVIKGLGLEKQGFKVVNQDISLEWLMKNHGLPTDMKDFTPEQASTFGKLGWDARMIAKRKQAKYQGKGDGIIVDGTGNSLQVMQNQVQEFKNKGYDVQMVFVETSLETALERNQARKERSLKDSIVKRTHESVQNNKEAFKELFGGNFAEVKTDNLKQGDPMPSKVANKMDSFTKGYVKGRLSAEEFANEGADILEQGGEFDFTEFDIIKEGKPGPLFDEAIERAKKYGLKDQFILTARPHAAKMAIYRFLDAQGLNIPFDNIITLEDSSPEAKALWIAKKVGEGYNDIYFADDALQNVQAVKNMLDQFDVKSKVQQAKRQSLYGNVKTKSEEETIKSKLGDIDNLTSPNNYNNIKFSRKHRTEYEKTISKYRPDLVKDGLVSQTIDNMFIFIDSLNIPNDQRRKYERITTKWLATSNVKLVEDRYKITDAINLAERFKLDLFSYNNPNEIIEAYAGKVKGKPINPNKVKEFSPSGNYPARGLTTYNVENTREGQQAVRDIIDSHWGRNSNPWCLTQAKNGKLTDDAWQNWTVYDDGPKRIVFQDGKLSSFFANGQFWDRMDNATDGPAIILKEGRVTKKVELVEVGDGKFEEFVMETRTVSEDGNTVTTEFNIDKEYDQGLFIDEAGTRIVENRVNGVTVKETKYRPNGDVRKITEFKDGKPISTRILAKGRTTGINVHNEHSIENGDFIQQEVAEGKTEYWYGSILLGEKVTEIGFQAPVGLDLMNIVKTVDGKMRVDFVKLLKIDPNVKGLPATEIKFSRGMDTEFNDILENVTGIDSKKRFSAIKARKRGASKGRFRFFIPPSHEDFVGLLYNFMGKGRIGDAHRDFWERTLIRPLNRAYRELNTAKQSIANDFKSLNKQFENVKKKLTKKTPDGDFTYQDAVRVYLWNKHGYKVPGLSPTDQQGLVDLVMGDPELQAYAETLNVISQQKTYVSPAESWEAGDIRTDLDDATGRVGREQFFTEFNENVGIIFSEGNFNKIEAAYGAGVVSAIKDILYRTKTGRNRPSGQNELTNRFMNYMNGSVAATMFFNIRSAVLQQMSMVNFINFADNNILAAAKAFANQKQYWTDWATIFNSDFMKQRRGGIKTDINGAELAASLKGAKNTPRALLAKLLELGFLPTQIGDNIAIATGGATFLRNRINTYLKQGLSQKEAESKAWIDFQVLAEATQQSARPDMVSQQQASPLGKIILAFQNVTSQFNRLGKKAFLDIKNRRITPGNATQLQSDMSNASRIAYYFAIQNLVFYALQTALFAAMFDDDEDDERMLKKKERILNGTLDSILRGSGVMGAVVSTIKNMAIKDHEQREKGYNADESAVLLEMLNISPPLGIKARKLVNAERTLNYNKSVIEEMETFDIDNPMWSAYTSRIEAVTNIPLNRLYNKTQNVRESLDNQHTATQRALMFGGWSKWNLGIGESEKIQEVKETIKEKKKDKSKAKSKIKSDTKKEEEIKKKEIEGEKKQKQEKRQGKKVTCLVCKLPIVAGKKYCTIHEKKQQRKDNKEVRCRRTKPDGKKCKKKTKNRSGLCYYHD